MHIPPFLRILLHHLPDSGYARCQYIYFLFGFLTMIFHSVRRVGFHLYMAVSTLQLTSIRNLSEYWQLLLKHTSRCRSIFGFHILLSDTAVESCVTFKPRKAPIQLIQFSMFSKSPPPLKRVARDAGCNPLVPDSVSRRSRLSLRSSHYCT